MDEFLLRRMKSQAENSQKMLDAKKAHNDSMAKTEIGLEELKRKHEQAQRVFEDPNVIAKIHTQFKDETKLNEKDIAFLLGATALQMLRWVLLPKLEFDFKKIPQEKRMDAKVGGKIEENEVKKFLSKKGISSTKIEHHIQKYTWDKLLIAPVPYDAMIGSEKIVIEGVTDFGKNIAGKNHHSATWGHDPVVGWVFGPMNITSRMITFRNFETYYVAQIDASKRQRITRRTSMGNMIQKSMKTWGDDLKTLGTSLIKQRLHLESDKYTKYGLPIPFVSPEKAQRLLLDGWNSNEVERLFSKVAKDLAVVGAQLGLAVLIDQLVKALHLMCYDETEDGSIGTYQVKSQKILCYSTGMAEIANGIYVASTGDIGKIDIGGYINFAKNLITAAKIKSQIETEFLEKELSRKIYGEEYYWEV